MESVSAYILRLVCACLICAVLQAVQPEGPGKEMRKILCGLFLIFTALAPLKSIDLTDSLESFPVISPQVHAVVETGTNLARETYFTIITDQTETYILDKAAQLHLQLKAEVRLDRETCVPDSVTITGAFTPYGKQQLMEYIVSTLGIRKENIRWTG